MTKRVHLAFGEGVSLDNRDLHSTEVAHPALPDVMLVIDTDWLVMVIDTVFDNWRAQMEEKEYQERRRKV